jgi:hypothetical protein
MALGRRNVRGVPPDVVTLFRIYSDQYRPVNRARTDVVSHVSSSSEGIFDESISSGSVKVAA